MNSFGNIMVFNTPKAESLGCYKSYRKGENKGSCPLNIKRSWYDAKFTILQVISDIKYISDSTFLI